ncbi:MAG: nucleotidyltransferase family protein [Pseudomonadota bacterium]
MHDRPDALMIFAAGFGTRMRPLTDDRPKPLLEVAGQTLIDRALALAAEAKPQRIVVNLHHLHEMLEAHLSNSPVKTVVEAPCILDTGGGLKNALSMLGEGPVVTVNPDAIWLGTNPITYALQAWDAAQMEALLVCVPMENVLGREMPGDFSIAADGRLRRGGPQVFGGVQIMKTDRLRKIKDPAFSLNVVWDQIMADGHLYGVEYDGSWCDVGRPANIELAEDMLRNANVS